MDRPPPRSREQTGQSGYGALTRAWFDTGDEVAAYEAGRTAERRRIALAFVGVLGVFAAVFAAILLLN